MVLGVLLSMPLTLPLMEQALRSTTAAARGGSVIFPVQLLDIVWPGWRSIQSRKPGKGQLAGDGQSHPSWCLVLALLALGGLRRRLGRVFWCVWAILCLGSLVVLPGPFNHARLGSLGALFLAMAAGLGVARLRSLGTPAMVGLAVVVLFSEHGPGSTTKVYWRLVMPQSRRPGRKIWLRNWTVLRAEIVGRCWDWVVASTQHGVIGRVGEISRYDLPVSEDTQRLMASLSSPPRGPWYPVDTLPSIHLLRFAGVRAIVSETMPASSEEWVEFR